MIDRNKMNPLMDLIRSKDWMGAHAMLDKEELADPGESTVAHWRAVVLTDQGRHQEALEYLADNMHRFNCKTNAIHKRACIHHELGNNAEALDELAKAPFDAEIEDYWALVMEAKFFQIYLQAKANLPVTPEQLAEVPDDYISLMTGGKRISKAQLIEMLTPTKGR